MRAILKAKGYVKSKGFGKTTVYVKGDHRAIPPSSKQKVRRRFIKRGIFVPEHSGFHFWSANYGSALNPVVEEENNNEKTT
jgi:hypothetical protein